MKVAIFYTDNTVHTYTQQSQLKWCQISYLTKHDDINRYCVAISDPNRSSKVFPTRNNFPFTYRFMTSNYPAWKTRHFYDHKKMPECRQNRFNLRPWR